MVMLRLTAEQFRKLPILANETTCTGKTYIITGGNSGLGFETAKHLVEFSAACVVLGVRNMEAGEKAKVEIEKSTGRKNVVQVWHIDMASHKSVRAFADRASTDLLRIDGLVANAGIMIDQWTTAEGMESSVTVNVINTILLGILMMPKLSESSRAYGIDSTIVFIVSVLGYTVKGELDKFRTGSILDGVNDHKRADMDARYPLTKLLEEFAAREFAARCPFEQTGVVITMVAPGLCSTPLGADVRSFTKAAHTAIKGFMARTPEVGSRTILHGLVAGRTSHGKLCSGCQIKEFWVPKWVVDKEGAKFQQRFWLELTERLEASQPGAVSRAMNSVTS